jgi:hypothetical protein
MPSRKEYNAYLRRLTAESAVKKKNDRSRKNSFEDEIVPENHRRRKSARGNLCGRIISCISCLSLLAVALDVWHAHKVQGQHSLATDITYDIRRARDSAFFDIPIVPNDYAKLLMPPLLPQLPLALDEPETSQFGRVKSYLGSSLRQQKESAERSRDSPSAAGASGLHAIGGVTGSGASEVASSGSWVWEGGSWAWSNGTFGGMMAGQSATLPYPTEGKMVVLVGR